jgi:hypothetical protein
MQVVELFFPLVFFTSGAYSASVSFLLKRIRDAGEENGSSDPFGHQEMRDRLAATIVRYNALTRGPTIWNTPSHGSLSAPANGVLIGLSWGKATRATALERKCRAATL